MHRRKQILKLVLVVTLAVLPLSAHSGTDADTEAWMKAMTPGEPHAELARQAGEWTYTVTFWEGPDSEPSTLEGVAVKTMIMGGRYLQEELTGQFMDRPFRGFGMTGYDNVTGEYVATWQDNMSTGIHYYTGQEQADGTHVYRSTMHDPATGRAIQTRSVARIDSDDRHSFESFMAQPNGKEYLHMRVEYTRAGR